MDIRTAFAILGLSEGASPLQVRAAYRDLVKVWHPDRFAHDPPLQAKAAEQLRQINAAFDLLQQPPTSASAPAPPPPSPVAEPPAVSVRVVRHGPPYQVLSSMATLAAAMMVLWMGGTVWRYLSPDLPDLLDPAAVMLDASRSAGGGLDRTYVEEPVASESDPSATPSLGYYATSIPSLTSNVEGSWLLNGKRITFHQGTIRAAGENAALGYYDPNTPRSLVYRKARNVHHVVVEVLFTPATMRWVVRDSGRRLVYEFVRVS